MDQLTYQMAVARQDELLRQASERRRIDETATPRAVAASIKRLKPSLRRLHRDVRARARLRYSG